jgi:hypothetical protein
VEETEVEMVVEKGEEKGEEMGVVEGTAAARVVARVAVVVPVKVGTRRRLSEVEEVVDSEQRAAACSSAAGIK